MKRTRPIIESLMDADLYKFTMAFLAFIKYYRTIVTYSFKNRTVSVPLARIISEEKLRAELDHVRTLKLKVRDTSFLSALGTFAGNNLRGFSTFLEHNQLPEYELRYNGDNIELSFTGLWHETILWETIALSIINELYYEAKMEKDGITGTTREQMYNDGEKRLREKIELIKRYIYVTITEFGTRRRNSRHWQARVVRILAEELGDQFMGTSNVRLAMDLDLTPIGTFAHEMYMVMSGIMHGSDNDIRNSHGQVLTDWWELYGYDLSIALTDTYGSDFFFRDFSAKQAQKWKGLRHDSGDPITFGEKAIAFYKNYGIDPKEKLLVFSDGLDVHTIIKIANHFHGRIKVSFGWGTNLTNDLGFDTLSLVIKATQSNDNFTVKLSDNLAKAMGPEEDVERFKKIFGHTNTFSEECKV